MTTSTKAQASATQKAFREGQQAYRDGTSTMDNRYPPEAVGYHNAWLQGYECEREVHFE